MKLLTTICYTICIACLLVSVVLAMLMIWTDFEFWWTWKVFASAAVFMTASVVALSLIKLSDKKT
ncbi:MAG: hypothetical protein ACPGYV_10430 [Phycisphaeraceae bacterium]